MHLYENRTPNHILVNIISEDKLKVTQFTFAPFSSKEFTYPALDSYVPALLTKICKDTGRILLPNKTKDVKEKPAEPVINEEIYVEECIIEVITEPDSIPSEETTTEVVEEIKEELVNEVKQEEDVTPKTKRSRKKHAE